METELSLILNMLAEGKITPAQASELIAVVKAESAGATTTEASQPDGRAPRPARPARPLRPARPQRPEAPCPRGDFGDVLTDAITASVDRGIEVASRAAERAIENARVWKERVKRLHIDREVAKGARKAAHLARKLQRKERRLTYLGGRFDSWRSGIAGLGPMFEGRGSYGAIAEISEAINDLSDAVDDLADPLEEIDEAVGEIESAEDFEDAAEGIEEISEHSGEAREALGEVDKSVQELAGHISSLPVDYGAARDALHALVETWPAASRGLKAFLEKADRVCSRVDSAVKEAVSSLFTEDSPPGARSAPGSETSEGAPAGTAKPEATMPETSGEPR